MKTAATGPTTLSLVFSTLLSSAILTGCGGGSTPDANANANADASAAVVRQGGQAKASARAPVDGPVAVTPDQVLVVINAASPISGAIGKDYQRRRDVRNVLTISVADAAIARDNETIGIDDYRARIEQPIASYLLKHPDINFIVLTKGVPIRVVGAPTGNTFNADGALASVDGQLAALGYAGLADAQRVTFAAPQGGAVGSAWLNRYWNVDAPFSHAKYGGYIVTRLDAYTLKQALGLVSRAQQAEAGLQAGPILLDVEPDFGIDDPASQPQRLPATPITSESPFSTWNADMVRAAQDLGARGVAVLLDQSPTFVGVGTPLQGYFSWGSNDDHYAPDAYHALRFLPGAIGDTAVSTSTITMLPPGSDGQSAAEDLIVQGITGVKGYINEPLLQAISSPSIVLDRYTRGYTLGESFAAGSRYVGWTDIIIGDPLAHPYPRRDAAGVRLP
jgi:uncharacterized protein (TIGR03790 family)